MLSQIILKNCVEEETDYLDIEEYMSDEISDIQYVFYATDSFNRAEYQSSIDYCEAFFDVERNPEKKASDDILSLQQLQPHERMALTYYTQLILAHSHFEYAKEFRKGSEEWMVHMESAEKECDAFEQSSKSLLYIDEKFKTLKDNIDMENGRWTEKLDEEPEKSIEIY